MFLLKTVQIRLEQNVYKTASRQLHFFVLFYVKILSATVLSYFHFILVTAHHGGPILFTHRVKYYTFIGISSPLFFRHMGTEAFFINK